MDHLELDAPILAFLEAHQAHFNGLKGGTLDNRIDETVHAWEQEFQQRNGVRPSQQQCGEKRQAARQAVIEQALARDAALADAFAKLHAEYAGAVAAAAEIPDAVERTFQQMRANRETVGMSRTELLLTRLLEHQEAAAIEQKVAGLTFDQLDAVYQTAVAQQELSTVRVLERHWRERWPTAMHHPDGLEARTRLEARILAERKRRVPERTQAGLVALEQAWNGLQFGELRRILRSHRFTVVV